MAADANKGVWQQVAGGSCQINNFRNVGEVIATKGDHIWTPLFNRVEIVLVRFALQIDQPHRMPGVFRCRGHKLEPEWLQPKINLRIHQTAGMNREEFHFITVGRSLFKTILQKALSC